MSDQLDVERPSKKMKLPRLGSLSILQAKDCQNDFFNLYNDSICSDSYNISGSSSSGDETHCVPIGYPTEIKQINKCASFDSNIDDSFSNFDGIDLDILERIVVGCEEDHTPKSRNRNRQGRYSKRRKSNITKPVACSTMIKSPGENKNQIMMTLSRKDSGISESFSSIQNDSIPCTSLQGPKINQTFVISRNDDSSSCEEDILSSKQEIAQNEIGMLSSIGYCSTRDIVSVEVVDEVAYAKTSFYNTHKGVPRTSTRAKLRLTPKKLKGSLNLNNKKPGKETTTHARSKPISRLRRLFSRKNKQGGTVEKKNSNPFLALSGLEKVEMIRKIRYFQERWSNKSADICTLANL